MVVLCWYFVVKNCDRLSL